MARGSVLCQGAPDRLTELERIGLTNEVQYYILVLGWEQFFSIDGGDEFVRDGLDCNQPQLEGDYQFPDVRQGIPHVLHGFFGEDGAHRRGVYSYRVIFSAQLRPPDPPKSILGLDPNTSRLRGICMWYLEGVFPSATNIEVSPRRPISNAHRQIQ